MNGAVSTKWRLRPRSAGASPRARPTICVMNRIGMGSSPRMAMAFWRRSRLEWHSGQATTMASAPWARAFSMMARPSRSTDAVRLTLKAPPQHSTFMSQSTASAPQALMTSSMEVGLLGVVVAADLERAHEQAAVVGGQLDALERVGREGRGDLLLDGRGSVAEQLDDVVHLDAVGERAAEDVGHPLGEPVLGGDREAGGREAVVAGGAGRERRCRSPAPPPAPGCAPAAPRRAGGRWCGRCWRRSTTSRRSR